MFQMVWCLVVWFPAHWKPLLGKADKEFLRKQWLRMQQEMVLVGPSSARVDSWYQLTGLSIRWENLAAVQARSSTDTSRARDFGVFNQSRNQKQPRLPRWLVCAPLACTCGWEKEPGIRRQASVDRDAFPYLTWREPLSTSPGRFLVPIDILCHIRGSCPWLLSEVKRIGPRRPHQNSCVFMLNNVLCDTI